MSANCVIAIKGFRSRAWTRAFDGYNSLETDLAILMDHLTLAAADRGIGSCWIANFDPEVLKEALSLKEDEAVFAITPLGYAPPDAAPARRTPRNDDSIVVRFL